MSESRQQIEASRAGRARIGAAVVVARRVQIDPIMETTKYQTRKVLGGAYRGKAAELKALLTHLVDVEINGEHALCHKVQDGNMADQYASTAKELAARPTCETCAKRWDRLQKA